MMARSQTRKAGAGRALKSAHVASAMVGAQWRVKDTASPKDRSADRAVPPAPADSEVSSRASGSARRDPVTAEQRAAAARIRIAYDKKRGHKTEAWIRKLAG